MTTLTRAFLDTVGVDSGTMTIATDTTTFAQIYDTFDEVPNVLPTSVTTSSGVGDGSYDVLGIYTDEALTGIEVVFCTPTIETLFEVQAFLRGISMPDWDEYYHTDLSPERRLEIEAQSEAYNVFWNEVHTDLYDNTLLTVDPTSESTPFALGTLYVENQIFVGDCCYRVPSCVFDLPSGTYQAWAYTADMGDWGQRVIRLGLYQA